MHKHDFYPRPPRGGRRQRSAACVCVLEFLSTPSARRATSFGSLRLNGCSISIHALREEGDRKYLTTTPEHCQFLSTPSARRATCGAVFPNLVDLISIHALREEGDHARNPEYPQDEEFLSTPSARRATFAWAFLTFLSCNFYPRPPRGGRLRFAVTAKRRKGFLSTPSARRATQPASCTPSTTGNFYPRPPRGGRPKISFGCSAAIENFYPRPPRGGRPKNCFRYGYRTYFYPRPPRGGRLPRILPGIPNRVISIHALREEGDQNLWTTKKRTSQFLSTPSARRATPARIPLMSTAMHFYPRPPRGGRPLILHSWVKCSNISIHALREEGDVRRGEVRRDRQISIHALREEGDQAHQGAVDLADLFLSTPSARRATSVSR